MANPAVVKVHASDQTGVDDGSVKGSEGEKTVVIGIMRIDEPYISDNGERAAEVEGIIVTRRCWDVEGVVCEVVLEIASSSPRIGLTVGI